jgi:hypothetical protein
MLPRKDLFWKLKYLKPFGVGSFEEEKVPRRREAHNGEKCFEE